MKTQRFGRDCAPAKFPPLRVLGTMQVRVLPAVLGSLLLTACSGMQPGNSTSSSTQTTQTPAIVITVEPATSTLSSGAYTQFSAFLQNTSDTAVTWTADGGSISSNGVFTAPKVSNTTAFHVTATSQADPAKSAVAVATVKPAVAPGHLAIVTATIPGATQGSAYTTQLDASGGQTPYSWNMSSGSLPSGLQLSSNGVIGGTTTQTGNFSFSASVTDASDQTVAHSYSVQVAAAQNGSFDGPAELPEVYVNSAMADTPAPGATISVKAGGDLQSALDSASCGDTIALQAGASFPGSFTIPAKACDDAHWIIIRTSAPDSALPPEGNRITPCYAGVASLPGRPAYPCPSPINVMAKIVAESAGPGPIRLADGANHVRFLGLELTRTAPGQIVYDLVVAPGASADHLVFDRIWAHGTPHDETSRGIALAGMTYAAVVDSYLNDFHCTAVAGACTDAQAIGGGVGDLPMGPYKIVDDFLEASGENVMFGGGPANQNPQDIEIRENHFYKPLIWMPGQPGFVGGTGGHPFIVKNHFELKNGVRILFEGNILENNWGGFSQIGFSILLTPKNGGGGFQIGNGRSDSGQLSKGAWNESIHDVVIDDVDATAYSGGGTFLQEGNDDNLAAIHDVVVNHVTAVGPNVDTMLVVGNARSNPIMNNFAWTNSIFAAGKNGVYSTGGTTNCAHDAGGPAGTLKACFNPYTFSHNAIIGAEGTWPSGTLIPATPDAVQFVQYNNGVGGNYELQSSSPYKNAGSDGLDLGANIAAVASTIANVQ
jgi:hypothetical protein